jgi:uncharacterized damage-inducible protein DinB
MSFARDHYRTMARYNAWANERLYAACARLPEAEYLKPRRAFFSSLHGTLNHILVGDRIWMSRFEGRAHGIRALDQILYGDLAGLQIARRAEDALIRAFVDGLDESDFDRAVRYTNMAGQSFADPLGRLLAHFFNHQTHHRGQAHDQLSQAGAEPPPLDLIYFYREAA